MTKKPFGKDSPDDTGKFSGKGSVKGSGKFNMRDLLAGKSPAGKGAADKGAGKGSSKGEPAGKGFVKGSGREALLPIAKLPLPPISERIFSRMITVDELGDSPVHETLKATEKECAALAAANGLPDLAKLEAKLTLKRLFGGHVHITGEMRCKVSQTCSVSLEPYETELVEPIEITFAPAKDVAEAEAVWMNRPDEDNGPEALDLPDPPDPFEENGRIDLGAVATEFFLLALDPYPRKPGVDFAPIIDSEPDAAESPFAALARLKADKK